jgi:hypothetical protein
MHTGKDDSTRAERALQGEKRKEKVWEGQFLCEQKYQPRCCFSKVAHRTYYITCSIVPMSRRAEAPADREVLCPR